MKRALYNQPDATPCGSTDNRKRNKTANLLHPFKNGVGKLLLTLFLMLASVSAWAQWTDPVSGVTYTPRAGSQGNTNETYDKACDGDPNTKFCLTLNGSAQVTIEASQAVYLKGYTITTANDNSGNAGRNPKNWTVAGSNTQNGTYTTIATVTNDAVLQDLNYAHYTFTCNSNTAYKFYRFTITATKGANVMQFSEFHPIAVTDQNTDFTFSTSYVIHNGTYYMGGTGRAGIGTFNPSTCIWNHDGNYLKDGSGYSLFNNGTPISNTNRSTILFGGNGNGVSVSSGKTIHLADARWLTWDGTNTRWTRTGTNTEPGTGYLYYLTTYNYPELSVAPTAINGATAISSVGTTETYSPDITPKYRKPYTNYVYQNATHFYDENNNIANAPAEETNPTYTWTLSANAAGHVSVDEDGNVTYDSYFSSDTDVTLTLVAKTTSKTFAAVTKTIRFSAKQPTTLTFANASPTITAGGWGIQLPAVTLKANETTVTGRTITYSGTGCNVNNNGTVTGIQDAGATITATFAGDDTYAASSATYTITGTIHAALNETVIKDIAIAPATADLDLDGTQEYSIPASVSATTRTCELYKEFACPTGVFYSYASNNNWQYTLTKPTVNENTGATVNLTRVDWSYSGGQGQYFQPTAANNKVTLTRTGQKTDHNQEFTITANATYGSADKTATAKVVILKTVVDITQLNAGTAISLQYGENESLDGHFSWQPNYESAGETYKNFTYTSQDVNVATVDANGNVTATGPGSTKITVQSKKQDGTNGPSCEVTVNVTLDAPVISIDAAGKVTITHPSDGVTIRYTSGANPADPTATSTVYNSNNPPTLTNEQYVKAIAVVNSNNKVSAVAQKQYITSGISGGKVILNDYEDHTWTYYAGVDSEVDGGNYNTNYAGKIYSPNPRNIKITYYGNGKLANLTTSVTGVKVGVDADANTFVYYKTIENNGGYKYTTIPNPFSVRPKIGTTYYGFVSWRVKSVTGGTITGQAVGSTINAETEITFVPTGTYTVNCTSMEVELEAVWDVAEVSTNGTFRNGYNSVERNFYVVSSSSSNNLPVVGTRCTYSSFYPNGTTNGTTAATMANRGTRRGNFTCTADSKVEYIILSYADGTINADAKNLTIGRGCSPASGVSANLLYGMRAKTIESPRFHLRVESGIYNYMSYVGGYYTNAANAASTDADGRSSISGTNTNIKVTMGSDYDRAATNGNNNLEIVNTMMMGTSANNNTTTQTVFTNRGNRTNLHTLDVVIKSGKLGSSLFMETATGNTTRLQGGAGYGHYFSMAAGQTNVGCRNILMEGGETCTIGSGIDVKNNTATGSDANNTTTNRGVLSFNVRIKGGIIHGNVYGGAAQSPSGGNRVMVVTGGQVKGWFAAGCNGTSNDGGQNYGTSWVYIGGNGRIDSEGSTKTLGYAGGGNVYAAGAGRSGSTTCGEMTFGSNLVIADNSYIERGAYGGGNYGYTLASSNIYITGGTNAGNNDGVTGSKGGVYGGANQQDGPEIKIWMTGGKMLGGVYGGCNTSGTISGNVTMQINGGQVGTDATHTGNVHGGGYGDGTVVSGNVELTLGNLADERGAKIYGNVYGGSALGTTGGTGKHTYVTVNRGSITGNVFGGGMGETGSNTKGVVTGAIKVDVYGTDPKPTDGTYALYGVYGGGDLAPYSGTPLVTVHNCDNSIEYVYGGGNATSVAGTDVTIWGGNKIGNVFGGGNGQVRAANISGSTNVKIYGGTIENVFPGSNTNGTIGGNLNLTIEKHAGTDGCEGDGTCPFDLGNVYSGGNKAASIIGNVTIGCLGNGDKITNLFGGAKQANVTGDVNLLITGNHIENVFGGNDISGQPSGTITVVVDWDPTCTGAYLGNVYGGGRDASYEAPNGNKDYPQVFVRNAVVEHDVFGGGLGESALVTGNPQVTVSTQCTTPGHTNDHMVHIKGSLYGGGSAAPVTGNPVVTTRGLDGDAKKVQIDNYVFGGGFGQTAVVTGNTEVNIKGNTVVNKNVYGGGNGGLVTGNTNIVIGD